MKVALMQAWVVPAAVAAVLVMSLGAGLALDHDRDGASLWTELGAGTSPWRGDTDGDGLPDGYELNAGLPARRADADRDGLLDGAEVAARSNPLASDSDGDGIPDGEEAARDCDGDGLFAVASSDDDADGRPDAAEPGRDCNADVDGDGVLDGREGNEVCIVSADCDRDGLTDGVEAELAYDPLDPDTFDTGLTDAVAYAFQRGGQDPGADADRDGIPDPWESEDGLIAWGGLQPEAGRRDLLVEYLRVVGPGSEKYPGLNFDEVYRNVARMFADEAGITMSWVETIVRLDMDERPDILTPETLPYYDLVLDGAVHTDNPFVTTVVLNPQQQQQHAGDVLGAAFLRSMIATIDYGAHTNLIFTNPDLGELRVSPVFESHVATGNAAKIRALGFESSGANGNRVWLRDADGDVLGAPGKVEWRPEWFFEPPTLTFDEFGTYEFLRDRAWTDEPELASTIAHEVGHTLGLCHAHESECFGAYSPSDREARHSSTMSYGAPVGTLHFLASEWDQVAAYLRCPPQQTVQLVADGGDEDALRRAKYQTSFVEAGSQRACGDLAPMPRQFEPVDATTYRSTFAAPGAVHGGGWAMLAHGALTAVAVVLILRRRP